MTPYEECWDALHSYLHKRRRKFISWGQDTHAFLFQEILNQMSDIENEILGEMEDE
tara:strand:+ start:943 stop:1110 length:168 start_codon:yes stop_codon:yes gene_type:complete